jgi:hypothetical protein
MDDEGRKLLGDALYLLNDRPRFGTRDRTLDSYKVAAQIAEYFRRHAAPTKKSG